ncbi:type II toxin-antitoxin system RelE/ParE family toxin [Candidatus Symbiothrix dinenymphae]|uniref:type II toxin-antitoxin system RelE/ParE family toxin n=1 Tax=Candidatus Symbiothrix dinenymphae TaxID=467085 RepID=UPI0009EAEA65
MFNYWNARNQSTEYSKKVKLKIDAVINVLKTHPRAGRNTDFADVRISPLGNFSILYKLNASAIIIVAFWDNRQDPNTLLALLQQA